MSLLLTTFSPPKPASHGINLTPYVAYYQRQGKLSNMHIVSSGRVNFGLDHTQSVFPLGWFQCLLITSEDSHGGLGVLVGTPCSIGIFSVCIFLGLYLIPVVISLH